MSLCNISVVHVCACVNIDDSVALTQCGEQHYMCVGEIAWLKWKCVGVTVNSVGVFGCMCRILWV